MKKSTRIGIIVLILILSIGFAAVATNLIINGTARLSNNPDDFEVYFFDAVPEEGGTATISNDKKSITYSTKKLLGKDSVATLEYTVHNNSSQYNARVSVDFNVTSVVDGVDYSEYFTVTRTGFGSEEEDIIYAKKYETGKITIKMIKDYFDEETSIDFQITLDVEAAERTTNGTPDEDVLEGTVYNELGQPMGNSSFVAFSEPVYFKTDENGHYKVKIPVGEHHVYYVPNKTVEELIAIEDEWYYNEYVEVDGEDKTVRELALAKKIKYMDNVRSTTVDTSITSDIYFRSLNVGDEFTIGDEPFVYLETNASGNMVLMSKYPLNLGTCVSYNNGGPVVQNKNGKTCDVAFSSNPTWKYEDTDAYGYVKDYVNYLKTLNSDYNVIDGNLLSRSQFNAYYLYDFDAYDCVNKSPEDSDSYGCFTKITLSARQGMESISNTDMWLGFLSYTGPIEFDSKGNPFEYEGLYFIPDDVGVHTANQTQRQAAIRPVIEVKHK